MRLFTMKLCKICTLSREIQDPLELLASNGYLWRLSVMINNIVIRYILNRRKVLYILRATLQDNCNCAHALRC